MFNIFLLSDEKRAAICSCAACEENLCEKHRVQHAQRKFTSSHVMSRIDENSPQDYFPHVPMLSNAASIPEEALNFCFVTRAAL